MGVELLEWLRIDDPIGAVPVHGHCGIWGTWSLGLFACGKYRATGPTAPDNFAPLTVIARLRTRGRRTELQQPTRLPSQGSGGD